MRSMQFHCAVLFLIHRSRTAESLLRKRRAGDFKKPLKPTSNSLKTGEPIINRFFFNKGGIDAMTSEKWHQQPVFTCNISFHSRSYSLSLCSYKTTWSPQTPSLLQNYFPLLHVFRCSDWFEVCSTTFRGVLTYGRWSHLLEVRGESTFHRLTLRSLTHPLMWTWRSYHIWPVCKLYRCVLHASYERQGENSFLYPAASLHFHDCRSYCLNAKPIEHTCIAGCLILYLLACCVTVQPFHCAACSSASQHQKTWNSAPCVWIETVTEIIRELKHGGVVNGLFLFRRKDLRHAPLVTDIWSILHLHSITHTNHSLHTPGAAVGHLFVIFTIILWHLYLNKKTVTVSHCHWSCWHRRKLSG